MHRGVWVQHGLRQHSSARSCGPVTPWRSMLQHAHMHNLTLSALQPIIIQLERSSSPRLSAAVAGCWARACSTLTAAGLQQSGNICSKPFHGYNPHMLTAELPHVMMVHKLPAIHYKGKTDPPCVAHLTKPETRGLCSQLLVLITSATPQRRLGRAWPALELN